MAAAGKTRKKRKLARQEALQRDPLMTEVKLRWIMANVSPTPWEGPEVADYR